MREYSIVCQWCGKSVNLPVPSAGRNRRYCGLGCRAEKNRAIWRASQRGHRERVAARLDVLERLVADAGLEVVNG